MDPLTGILSAGNTNLFDADEETSAESNSVHEEIDSYRRNRAEQFSTVPDHSKLSQMIYVGLPVGELRSYMDISPSMKVIVPDGFQESPAAVVRSLLGLLKTMHMAQFVAQPEGFALFVLEKGSAGAPPLERSNGP